MAEFFNDQQRQAHLDALELEKQGYEALLARVDLDEASGPSKKRIEKTIDEIDAEIARISGLESVEEDVDGDEKTSKGKGGKKKAAAGADGGKE